MKLVSLLLGFFSFTLALESETSGALLQESEEATAGASSIEYGIIKLVDRGRRTPIVTGKQNPITNSLTS